MDKWYVGLTEDAIRERVVKEAIGLLGIQEGTIEHQRMIVDVYNSLPKLPRGVALTPEMAWCAATMSVIGINLGITDVILPEMSCTKMIELYKARGRWMEADDYVPKPGDLVMYDWDAKKGECTGAPDHVGMVVRINGNNIRVFEGNYDNKTKYRDICVEYIKVRGYCLPDYGSLVQAFADVAPGAWYAQDVARAAELGLMEGVGGGRFEPDRAPTRAELAAVAVRLAEMLK